MSRLTRTMQRAAGSPATRAVLLTAYLAIVLYLLAPVLVGTVSADDRVWVLRFPALYDGSPVAAWWGDVRQALAFKVQDRSTALAFAERSALAVVVMNASVALAVPPAVFWSLTKLVLIALSVLSARVLCQTVRFRGRDGAVRGLSRETVGYVTLAMPLVVAIGAKSQNFGGLNGWTGYPTLCLGLFPTIMLATVVAMRADEALTRRYRRLVLPVVALFVLWGIVVTFSFELLVVAVPAVGVAMLLHPRETVGSFVRRWRAPVTIAGAFGLSWAASYAATRVAIGARTCTTTDSCYQGTVIDVHLGTLVDNLGASLPIGSGSYTAERAHRAGVALTGPSTSSLLVGVLAVAVLGALTVLLREHYRAPAPDGLASTEDPHDEVRGLGVVGLLMLVVALGSAVITGVTELAVRKIVDLSTAYHVGPVVWTAVALLVLVALRALWLAPRPLGRWLGPAGFVVAALVVVALVTVMLPRNQLNARLNAHDTRFAAFLQGEVALDQRGSVADTRRCTGLRSGLGAMGRPLSSNVQRQVVAAYQAFEHYHHRAFCSATSVPDVLAGGR